MAWALNGRCHLVRVYLVDDSSVVTERLITLLNDIDGVDIVGSADNADAGIANIAEHRPDVAILDIRMPSGSGILVLNEVKKLDDPPTVIMLTNYPYPHYRSRCMDSGADYFFDKSNEFEQVIEVLEQMVAARRRSSSD